MTIAWGIVATAAAAIRNRTGLVVQRFFLGVAEAGAARSDQAAYNTAACIEHSAGLHELHVFVCPHAP